jgi:Family of unknown function (DUF5681)
VLKKKEYAVGYGKPPQATRFKAGQSGNPSGRPKGTRNLATDLHEELNEKITVREGTATRSISKQRAVVKSLMNAALKGDTRATAQITALIDRYMEKVEREKAEQVLGAEDQAILERFQARTRRGGGD